MSRKPEPLPWERQRGESTKAFAHFQTYRNLPPLTRSIEAAARADGVLHRTILTLARKWDWYVRAAAWDAEVDREAQAALRQEARDMARRHVQIAKAIQAKGLQKLQVLNPAKMNPRTALRYLTDGAKLERLALGEPTEVLAPPDPNRPSRPREPYDLEKLSPEELEQWIALQQKTLPASPDAQTERVRSVEAADAEGKLSPP